MTMPINAKDIPDLVHWYRGMLLMPEHFRAAAARGEMLPPYLLQAASPLAWGVRALVLALEGAEVVIDAVEAVLPDGMVVAIDRARGDAPLRYTMDPTKTYPSPGQPVDLYLAVAAWTPASLDLDGANGGAPRRYRDNPDRPTSPARLEEDDLQLGGGIALQPEVTLVVGTPGDPPLRSFTLLRLARLGLQDSKPVLLDYEPPRMRIADATLIARRVALLVADMHARAANLHADLGVHRALTQTGTAPAEAALEGGGAQDGQIQALIGELRAMRMSSESQRATRMGGDAFRALVRLLPRLRTMLQTGVSHPFDVYLALCDALGELALVSPTLDLDHLPAYDHQELLRSFDALIAAIQRALAVFDLRYRIVPFTRRSDTSFEVQLEPEDLEGTEPLLIGAVSPRTRPRDEQREWLKNATIAMQDTLDDIRFRRVSGWTRVLGIGRDTKLGVSETPQLMLARIHPDPDITAKGGVLVIESKVGEGPVEINFYRPVQQPGAAPDTRSAP